MKETELKSLLEQRPQFSTALVESLDDALSRLKGCVHFHQYRGVPLRNFLSGTSGTFDPISQEPLQEICEQGAVKICEHPSLEVGNVRALVMLINHLAEVDPSPPRAEQMPEVDRNTASESRKSGVDSTEVVAAEPIIEQQVPSPMLSSSQVEDEKVAAEPSKEDSASLARGVAKAASDEIVSSENISSAHDDSPEAKLSGEAMSADTTSESSSSVVSSEVGLYDGVVERHLATNVEEQQVAPVLSLSDPGSSSDYQPKTLKKSASNVLSELVRVSLAPQAPVGAAMEFFPSYARILVSHLRELSTRGGASHPSPFISSLLERVSQSLRDEELVVFWFSSEHGIEPVEALFGVSQEWTLACHAKVRGIVTEAVEVLAPNIIEAITLGLHAPIIPLGSLLRCLDADPEDTVSVVVGKMVLSAFGAREGIFREAPIRGLWSAQVRVAHILVDAVLNLLPAKNDVIQRELQAIFPVLDPEQRMALIAKFAIYDEPNDRWSRGTTESM